MKRIILLCMVALITLPGLSVAAVAGPARIRNVYGESLFRTPDSEEWLQASVNTPLDEGDAVWCPDGSRVEIQLPDGTVVRLDGGTQIDMIANEDGFAHLHLASGRLYMRTDKAARDNSLQIDADDTTVLPSARTRLRIDILPEGQEDVAITKGAAYVEGNGSRTRVRAGEHILMEDGFNEILPLNPADSWEVWNEERDREMSRSAKSESYVPEELRSYSAELDASGSWVRAPEYGMVWRPTVIVSADWAPYRHGRWIWKGNDYVWLSYEGWGWAPYHYGRWAMVRGIGWCWVPPARGDVYWGPGYVGWYQTGSQVAWTPLAPNETYYGRRYYGRNSVNITTVKVNTNTVVYRNRANPGGLNVMTHSDFQKGRMLSPQASRNPSVPVTAAVGGPHIQPTRESRMPIVKQTPPRVAPPETRHQAPRELRDRFPRVTPAPAGQQRRSQPASAPAVPTVTQPAAPRPATPAAPSATPVSRPPQSREHQPGFPAVAPSERAATPARQAPPQGHQQREERQQRPSQPAAVPQSTPPAMQTRPPVSGAVPQRSEQPRPATTTQPDTRNRPMAAPQRGDARQTPQTAGTPPATTPAQRDMKQKKVWNVQTPETVSDKNTKDTTRDNGKGKDRKDR